MGQVPLEPLGGPGPANTLISNFGPPDHERKFFCGFQPPCSHTVLTLHRVRLNPRAEGLSRSTCLGRNPTCSCPTTRRSMVSFGQKQVLWAWPEQRMSSASAWVQGQGCPRGQSVREGAQTYQPGPKSLSPSLCPHLALAVPHVCKHWHCTWEAQGEHSIMMMMK